MRDLGEKTQQAVFAAQEGNGALDVVWRQAFRSERATTKGGSSAAVSIDMKSFYDHFEYDLLQQRADRTGFPRKLTRWAIRSYQSARRVVENGLAATPFRAGRGIVAGCGFATTWVKVYCLEAFTTFVKRHPGIRLDAYIDDLTVAVEAGTDE